MDCASSTFLSVCPLLVTQGQEATQIMHIRAFADDKLRKKLAHVVIGMTKWGHFTVYDLCDFGRKSSKQALVVFNGW